MFDMIFKICQIFHSAATTLGIHLAQENFYASTGYLVKVGSE